MTPIPQGARYTHAGRQADTELTAVDICNVKKRERKMPSVLLVVWVKPRRKRNLNWLKKSSRLGGRRMLPGFQKDPEKLLKSVGNALKKGSLLNVGPMLLPVGWSEDLIRKSLFWSSLKTRAFSCRKCLWNLEQGHEISLNQKTKAARQADR